MNEDWRVRLALDDGSRAKQKSLASSLASELGARLGDSARVTSGGAQVFVYADTSDAAGEAAAAARDLLAQHIMTADVRLQRWDHAGQIWEDAAAVALDASADQPSAADLQDVEWSEKTGLARWQVRVQLAAHHQVAELAQRLASEGWPVVQRRKYLIAGANIEDDARRLAAEIQGYTSADAAITVKKTIVGWAPLDIPSLPG